MKSFLNTFGFLLQFAALVFLPALVFWQLDFGFRVLWMPSMTILGIAMFTLGHYLRQKTT